MTDNPFEHVSFMRQFLGEEVDNMRTLSQSLMKVTKKDEKLITQHYKNEIKRIKELRMSGVSGSINLNIPDVLL